MATTIVTKKGSGAPAASDLVEGELAVDTTNGRLYTENSSAAVVELGSNPSGNITFGDNGKAIFGAGSDLQIYHDGSNSYIVDNGTGDLLIRAENNLFLKRTNSDETYLSGAVNGAVTLFHNNNAKIATTISGIDVTGSVTADGLTVDGNATISNATNPKLEISDTTLPNTLLLQSLNGDSIVGTSSNTSLALKTNNLSRIGLANNGDISFYEDTGTTAKFFWDASAESLGIGTTSPAQPLEILKTSAGAVVPMIQLRNGSSSAGSGTSIKFMHSTVSNATSGTCELESIRYSGNLGALTFKTSNNGGTVTERMRVNDTGVGIGTSSPSFGLSVEKDNGSGYVALFRKSSSAPALTIQTTVAGITQIQGLNAGLSAVNDIAMQTSGGNVGIGTGSPSQALSVESSSTGVTRVGITNTGNAAAGAGVQFITKNGATQVSNATLRTDNAGNFSIFTGTTSEAERMRLDSSGNLLVGKTSANDFSSAGVQIEPAGQITTSIGGDAALKLNRGTNDGNIIELNKAGSLVGSIGTYVNLPYIGKADVNLLFDPAGPHIIPRGTNGGARDAAINLGASTNRFKDLYLSGSITSGANGGLIKEIGGDTSIVQGAIGLRINDAALALSPTTASANSDAAVDLGVSNIRFKDLYLSGDVNVTGGKISSYASDSSAPYFADAGNVGIRLSRAGVDDIVPCSTTGADRDNGINFGAAGARWGTIFAATGAINTSDQNEKQDIAELSEAEQRVAVAAKGLLRKFRWKDSVAEKGDAARTHVGIMAQDLQAAFAAEGLNASDYAMWCSDTWTDKETGEEHTRMGVRYSELLAFIIAAL